MSQFYSNSIFWIDVDKIKPNPYQPRREFEEARLKDLADSIRMYGVLQPLVVTRKEVQKEDGGLASEYELISGERRLRASKLAGIREVPAIIRADTDDARLKLELAIIENLQREDLNAVDRARAFHQLHEEFKFKHSQIAEKVGKSREYVTNTIRLLELPTEMLTAVQEGRLSEGHTRPLLMLTTRPAEQLTLYKEILFKKLTVREAEHVARNIAVERVKRRDNLLNPELFDMEARMSEVLGTRVRIEHKGPGAGGRVQIDFFSEDDLRTLMAMLARDTKGKRIPAVAFGAGVVANEPSVSSGIKKESVVLASDALVENKEDNDTYVVATDAVQHQAERVSEGIPPESFNPIVSALTEDKPIQTQEEVVSEGLVESVESVTPLIESAAQELPESLSETPIDDRSKEEKSDAEAELYSIKNFSL